jgi:hypothetical protein
VFGGKEELMAIKLRCVVRAWGGDIQGRLGERRILGCRIWKNCQYGTIHCPARKAGKENPAEAGLGSLGEDA